MTQRRTSPWLSGVLVGGSAVALVGGLLAGPSATAGPLADGSVTSKIAPAVGVDLQDGSAELWVRLAARADLAATAQLPSWHARGRAVYRALTSTAERSQRGVRAYLDSRGVPYEAFHITNSIYVPSGTAALAGELAAYEEVGQILPAPEFGRVEPVSRQDATAAPDGPEWGLESIHAPEVWERFAKGRRIVVANIDSGVQWDHPALRRQYRGRDGNHDYNWQDVYGDVYPEPTDPDGHGTHVMGTMVGDDRGANQIGVAPRAKWIASNGCNSCTPADVIDAAEWMLAPTKVDGTDPKPRKRPHVVNNSWYTFEDEPVLQDLLDAWEASGIFGQWAIGNFGPSCSSSVPPGHYDETYAAGAYDINHQIADFSSRGPGPSGEVKPNIAAPGVDVRSSVPGDGYDDSSGTSMASPHVAGAIALLWSEVPSLRRDIPTTRALLDDTAANRRDLECGGTADDNNVWGEGRLDALALVKAGRRAEALSSRALGEE